MHAISDYGVTLCAALESGSTVPTGWICEIIMTHETKTTY